MMIRLFRPEDADQVEAWAPDNIHFRDWATACSQRFTYVADAAGLIIGFGELESDPGLCCHCRATSLLSWCNIHKLSNGEKSVRSKC